MYLNDSMFSTAELKIGSGTSGMLVTEVKKQMKSTLIVLRKIVMARSEQGLKVYPQPFRK